MPPQPQPMSSTRIPGASSSLPAICGLLLCLRLFQRVVGGLEVGAGILLVVVEEQVVELARQVVVMRHVLLRLADRIVLRHRAQPVPQPQHRLLQPERILVPQALHAEPEKAAQVVVLDGQGAVHIGLADREIGLGQDPRQHRRIAERHPDRRHRRIPSRDPPPRGQRHLDPPAAEHVLEHPVEHSFKHGSPRRSCTERPGPIPGCRRRVCISPFLM